MHCIYPSISINYWQGLTELKSAILPAVATNIFSSSKSRQDSISFFKTKQQEFIHPLILSPTHETKLTKIQKNRVCFPSCSSWPNELSNWPFNQSNQKSVKPTTQKPNNRYHRIKTKYVPQSNDSFLDTDKLFVFAIYQHGWAHGMEGDISQVVSLSVLWASTSEFL